MAANIKSLTGLRAVAALMVLALHATQSFPNPATSTDFVNRGYVGVDLFFILSGFIITHVYIDSFRKDPVGAIGPFLWHRVARLYPAYLTALACVVVIARGASMLGVPMSTPEAWDHSDLPWHLLMLQAWGTVEVMGWNAPAWSVSAEIMAYIAFPVFVRALIPIEAKAVAIVGAIVPLGIMATVYRLNGWGLSGAWAEGPATFRILCEFSCGSFLCRLAQLGCLPHRHLGAAALASFAAAACVGTHDFVLIALLALVVFGACSDDTSIGRVMRFPPAVWVGTISYSIYIAHFPTLLVLRRVLPPGFGAFLLATTACIAAGAALYYAVERPGRNLLRSAPDRPGTVASD